MACNHLVVDIVWFVFLEIHRFLRSKSKVLETYGVWKGKRRELKTETDEWSKSKRLSVICLFLFYSVLFNHFVLSFSIFFPLIIMSYFLRAPLLPKEESWGRRHTHCSQDETLLMALWIVKSVCPLYNSQLASVNIIIKWPHFNFQSCFLSDKSNFFFKVLNATFTYVITKLR